jgi:hypothetical protein
MYCFIYLLCIACVWLISLDDVDFENLQELEIQDLEQQLAGNSGK